jgi:hypothetical protein
MKRGHWMKEEISVYCRMVSVSALRAGTGALRWVAANISLSVNIALFCCLLQSHVCIYLFACNDITEEK